MRKAILTALVALATAGAALADINASERRDDLQLGIRNLRLRVQNEPIIVNFGGTGTNHIGSATLYTLDAAHVAILSAESDLVLSFTSDEPATGSGLHVSIGTAANIDADLTDATDADIVAVKNVDPWTNSVSRFVSTKGAAATVRDGTSAGTPVVLNVLVDAADMTGPATGTVSGVIHILYGRSRR